MSSHNIKKVKKKDVTSQECQSGAHLPEPIGVYIIESMMQVPLQSQTYDYLPNRRALPLPIGQYSFPNTLRVGG